MNVPTYADDGSVHVVIESPRGSTSKFKYEPSLGSMMLSRPLPLGLAYPCDWGFVAGTKAEDGDPLDAFVLWDGALFPGVIVKCRPVAVLRLEQTPHGSAASVRNDRVAVVPVRAPRDEGIQSVDDILPHTRQELEQFFAAAVAFEPKTITLLGWGDASEAAALIGRSRNGGTR